MHSELEKVRRHIRILADLGRLAGETADVDRFLDRAVVQVARAVEIDHVKILQYRPRTADFLVVAGQGWKQGVIRSATLSSDFRSPPGRTFQTGEPTVIRNFNEQDDYILSEFLKSHGIISLSNVPIMIGGAAWGVLEVDSTMPRELGEDTTQFLIAAGALVGVVVERQDERSSETEQLAAATARVQSRDTLLHEMKHRVKNNFQLILASIYLQKRRYAEADVQQALDHVASRINAISLAHDQLTPRQEGQLVRLSDYLIALCHSLRQQTEIVEIDVEADDIDLTIDRAVPLGLILNEVATNSLKHAFGPEGGALKVKLTGGIGYGEGRLTVSDNGRGISNPNPKGSGLKLINSLAGQVGGMVEQKSSDEGTITSVVFPLIT